MSKPDEPVPVTATESSRLLLVAGDVVRERMAGPGIRALELARALRRRGVDVRLAVPGPTTVSDVPIVVYDVRGQSLRAAANDADAAFLQSLVLAKYPFFTQLDLPLVIDLYDPFVLENLQAREAATPAARRRGLASDLAALTGELRRGDFFVCASPAQRDLWTGMLLAAGRIGPSQVDADPSLDHLIDLVPFGVASSPPEPGPPAIKGVVDGIGPNDLVVLWNGGIWPWFDPETAIRGVGRAAETDPRLKLFFMGAGSPSPSVRPSPAAEAAREVARRSGLLDRHVFFNTDWVPYADRGRYLADADLIVSTHLPHLETRYAFRTRLLDAIWAGVPQVVTGGDVLSARLADAGVARAVPPSDVEAVAGAVLAMSAEAGRQPDAMAVAFEALRSEMSWDAAIEPLVAFMAQPRRAPDLATGGAGGPIDGTGATAGLEPTPMRQLPVRAAELMREGGPLLLFEEAIRYIRWLRRPQ